MAKALQYFPISITAFLLLLTIVTAEPPSFAKRISPKKLGLNQEEMTHLHFYFHDIQSSKNPTAIPIVQPFQANSSTSFGLTVIADNPLTVAPDLNSKVIGKAQGIYAAASQTDLGLLMLFNFVFSEGMYNGSTLTMMGRNAVFSGIREMPIVGGTKVFRFARGYAQAKTHTFNITTGNAVVEYNVYVNHCWWFY